MKIIQYNIYFGNHLDVTIDTRLENICGCLIDESADVLCLQEVLQSKYELLVALLFEKYPYVYPDSQTGLALVYETVIFSKHPIKKATKHDFEFTTMGRDIKLIMIQNTDQKKIYICTTHFESEFKDGCMKKIYQYNRCSDILTQIHKRTNIPIFLCADTNICKTSDASFCNSFSLKNGWRDAWIETGADTKIELTFNSDTNPILIERYGGGKSMYKSMYKSMHKSIYKSRLDRIIHISDWHCSNFKLIGTDPMIIMSDHYGVVCTFSENKPEGRGEYIDNYSQSLLSAQITPDPNNLQAAGYKKVKSKVPTVKLF